MAMASTHQEEAEQINMVNPTVNTRSNEDFDDGDGKFHLNNMMLAVATSNSKRRWQRQRQWQQAIARGVGNGH